MQSMQEDRTSKIEKDKGEEREVPKRAASTPLEEGGYSRNYTTFGLLAVEKRFACENCKKRHEILLCQCPNCGGLHLISKCPFSGVPEGETIPKAEYREPWKQCSTCHLCHHGTCPCHTCGELAHVSVDCIVAGMEQWSGSPTTKR